MAHCDLPPSCYTFIGAEPGSRIGFICREKRGFCITRIDQKEMSECEVRELVDSLNRALGVSTLQQRRLYQLAITGRVCRA